MASKTSASIALFFAVNILFFALVSSCDSSPSPKPKPKPKPKPHPKPTPHHAWPGIATCPKDTLKLGVCADVLKGLLQVKLGTPPVAPCCSLIEGLADLEAALCLCTVLKANVLGIHLDVPLSLTLLLNVCSKNVPHGFKCA